MTGISWVGGLHGLHLGKFAITTMKTNCKTNFKTTIFHIAFHVTLKSSQPGLAMLWQILNHDYKRYL